MDELKELRRQENASDGFPPQAQDHQPGKEWMMRQRPKFEPLYPGVGKLRGKVVLITGGDSGIGRATAIAMAREGADVVIAYLDEHDDAAETKRLVEMEGSRAFTLAGDIGDETFCGELVGQTLAEFGRLDVVVNNAAEQHLAEEPLDITRRQLERTFRTNVFGAFYLTKAALPFLKEGAAIIFTTSITAYEGNESLIDYSATKGALVALTRSLSQALIPKGIRVNAVAPGPVWTPLIPASFDAERVSKHGENAPMARAGQPNEIAPSFVFLASSDSSYMSGQVLHPNGGTIVES